MKNHWKIGLYSKIMLILALALSLMSCGEDANMRNLRQAVARGEDSYKKYKTADYPTAKAALLDFIRYLDEQTKDPEYPEPVAADMDIMISYVRLAKLEEKNNGTEKEHYMQQALARCQQLVTPKWDCTAERMRELVDQGDAIVQVK